MKKIQLGHHQNMVYKYPVMYALVDDNDFEALNKYKWSAQYSPMIRGFYASRRSKESKILMHTQIMNTPKGMHTDHINRNTLDNRRKNLRICTPAQNLMNSGLSKNNTSGFKCVFWDKSAERWRVKIKRNGKSIYLGTYMIKEAAYDAYVNAVKRLDGEYFGL